MVSLAVLRIILGIPIAYLLATGYVFTVILSFFTPPDFVAISFDAGGVTTGPMTVTFIMALAVGAADQIEGRDAIIDGFGLVALVALAPIIMVMLLGFLYAEQEHDDDTDKTDHIPAVETEAGQPDSRAGPNSPDLPLNKELEVHAKIESVALAKNNETEKKEDLSKEVNSNDGHD